MQLTAKTTKTNKQTATTTTTNFLASQIIITKKKFRNFCSSVSSRNHINEIM